jgi:hypothetical protein
MNSRENGRIMEANETSKSELSFSDVLSFKNQFHDFNNI